jgi:hypothetical protein
MHVLISMKYRKRRVCRPIKETPGTIAMQPQLEHDAKVRNEESALMRDVTTMHGSRKSNSGLE